MDFEQNSVIYHVFMIISSYWYGEFLFFAASVDPSAGTPAVH